MAIIIIIIIIPLYIQIHDCKELCMLSVLVWVFIGRIRHKQSILWHSWEQNN